MNHFQFIECVIVRRDTGEKAFVPLAELEEKVQELLKALHTNLYESAKKRLEENTYACTTVEEVKANMEKRKGFAKTMWCGNLACELAEVDIISQVKYSVIPCFVFNVLGVLLCTLFGLV